jgi:hypothetical protein
LIKGVNHGLFLSRQILFGWVVVLRFLVIRFVIKVRGHSAAARGALSLGLTTGNLDLHQLHNKLSKRMMLQMLEQMIKDISLAVDQQVSQYFLLGGNLSDQ